MCLARELKGNTFENMNGSIAKFNVRLEATPEQLADLDKATYFHGH